MGNTIKKDDLGVPLFYETPKLSIRRRILWIFHEGKHPSGGTMYGNLHFLQIPFGNLT